MKNILIYTLFILIFVGCGGGGGSSSTPNARYNGPMTEGEEYTVFPGDKVEKVEETATLISITHKDGEESSIITLVSGKASIVRSNQN